MGKVSFVLNRVVVFLLIICFLGVCFMSYNKKTMMMKMEKIEKSYQTYNLIRVVDKQRNTTYISVGYTEEILFYNFLYTDNDTIKHMHVKVDDINPKIVIIETNTTEPKYVKYGLFYRNKEDKYYTPRMIRGTKNILFVPEGTVNRKKKINN